MQQEKTYELTRITMDDVFSTKPLNDNAEIVENALSDLADADTSLAQRFTALGVKHIAYGIYRPSSNTTVETGFQPKVVFAISLDTTTNAGAFVPRSMYSGAPSNYTILSNGFQVRSGGYSFGDGSHTYAYLALA